MPRIVDHDERRLVIAAIVEELVYEHGVEALTLRDLARRAGYSTTVISHYFRSKLDMLLFTHQSARARAEAALSGSVERGGDLVDTLIDILPTTEARKRDWNTWFAFWGMAPGDPRVAGEWHAGTSQAHDLFKTLVGRSQAAGRTDPNLDPHEAADMIQVIVNGIASLWAQERERWTIEAQKALLIRMLAVSSIILLAPVGKAP